VKVAFEPMTDADFAEMAEWRYEPPYDFYDGDVDPVLNPERFFAARDEHGALAGHLYFEQKGDRLEYGLGLRPDLVGRGLGEEFFRAGLDFGRDLYKPGLVQLSVAKFNDRARIVYERCGFRVSGEHERTFERFGVVPFLEMEEVVP
jgi:RimJ/RimL family protein N-acetyltransferase